MKKRTEAPTKEAIDAANDAIARALSAGHFDRWKGEVWQKAKRDEVRAAVRSLVDERLSDLHVRMTFRARDAYKEENLRGDLDAIKDGWIEKMWLSVEPMPATDENPVEATPEATP